MMDVKEAAKLLLGNTAMLAFVVVSFKRQFSLCLPIRPTPFFLTASPCVSVFTVLVFGNPFSVTFRVTEKISFVFDLGWHDMDNRIAVSTRDVYTFPSRIAWSRDLLHSFMITGFRAIVGALNLSEFYGVRFMAEIAFKRSLFALTFFTTTLSSLGVRLFDLKFFTALLADFCNAFLSVWLRSGYFWTGNTFSRLGKIVTKTTLATESTTGSFVLSDFGSALFAVYREH